MSNAREQAIEILRDWMRHQRGPAWDLGNAVDALIAADLLPTSGPEPTEERRPLRPEGQRPSATSDSFREAFEDALLVAHDGGADPVAMERLYVRRDALLAAEP